MNLDIAKGLLILLVVIDHNDFSRSLFPGFLLGLSFHVAGFLSIPFLKPARPLFTREFVQYAFRLYYPFLLVACCTWLALTVAGHADPLARVGLLLHALASGNSALLKAATGMALLWFLPSFIALIAVRSLLADAPRALRRLALAAVVLIHPLIGAVAPAVQDYLPLGLLPALYIVPLALLAVALQRRVFDAMRVLPAVAWTVLAYGVAKAVQMHLGLYNEIGFALVADFSDLGALAANDAEAVTGTLMVFQLCRLPLGRLAEVLGQASMQVYLLHAFVALALARLLVRLFPHWPVLALFLASLAGTVALTLALARLIVAQPRLRALVFPRTTGEWKAALARTRRPGSASSV
ncbi:MAG: acyltransferase family protein [Gammaproteobacteria bacterium]